MTTKLYENDPNLFSFTATVRTCLAEGNGYAVTLDRTAFFPCEGGQGADHGTLGGAEVTDVLLRGEEVVHLLDAPLAVGVTVAGEVNAVRRRRHMQVHTGEHILSGVLHTLYGVTNVGFHLGDSEVTLDTDIPLSAEELATAEEAANRAVFENRRVRVLWPTPEELSTLSYRAKLALTEGVRLVEIEGVDLCACCAPHVASTGECGLIKIVSAMHYKGGMRLCIAVGQDALADYRRKQENIHAASVSLSVPEERVGEGVQRLLSSLSEERRRAAVLAATLRRERLSALSGGERELLVYSDLEPQALASYAEEGAALSRMLLVLLPEEGGCRYALASRTLDVRETDAALHAALGGRGGGRAVLTQGFLPADAERIKREFLGL